MAKYNILYIDDDASKHGLEQIQPMIDTLEESDELKIHPFQSGPFDKISESLIKIINDFDAIIFDYQLDDRANDEGERGNMKAPVLAQHLRTEITNTERSLKDIPFILCSTNEKLQKSFTSDSTSHDLFDLKFKKDSSNLLLVTKRIRALVEGYNSIERENDLSNLLQNNYDSLDNRILSKFLSDKKKLPAHEYANSILKDLVYINGPLIGHKTLAARLGIDIENSPHWPALLENYFMPSKYSGVFSGGWDKWWMDSVNDIFLELTGSSLSSIDARERVSLLTEKTECKELKLSDLIEGCRSYRYWTICKSYDKPLDPREAFRAYTKKEPKPWQDHIYISKPGALDRVGFEDGLEIHPNDYDRYRLTIENLKNEGTK
ncbi:hypothetical protein KZY98_10005 [Croceibacter atlanticus]|uniref:hypothetical protein n=1 Tax=Croceibacter atlanticus TaxID=313588 RepID=UPI001C5D6328|nr:hypothetical protein [Croceibacter atlanticus]MBW4970791.1 hypothetical protein [Croceibacter atlanticus]